MAYIKKGKPRDDDEATLDMERLPAHVAIIMDGSGRWATARMLPRVAGHRAGMEALRPIIQMSDDIGIKALTLFAFSTENWTRPKAEVGALMGLILEYFNKEIDELDRKNVRIKIIGDKENLPAPQYEAVMRAETRTGANTGLTLNIALNYGGRAELTHAARTLCERALAGELEPAQITEEVMAQALYTGSLGDLAQVDLLIRTSGEQRLSGFLLWQCAYAELYFAQPLWPDFDTKAYTEALIAYQSRNRRFGGLGR